MENQITPELGALYTEVEEMMDKLGKEQKILITKQLQIQEVQEKRRRARIKKINDEAIFGVAILIVMFTICGLFMWVAYDRSQKYPQYGDGLFPMTQKEREEAAKPKIYIGR